MVRHAYGHATGSSMITLSFSKFKHIFVKFVDACRASAVH
jgi:hypothetical protein